MIIQAMVVRSCLFILSTSHSALMAQILIECETVSVSLVDFLALIMRIEHHLLCGIKVDLPPLFTFLDRYTIIVFVALFSYR